METEEEVGTLLAKDSSKIIFDIKGNSKLNFGVDKEVDMTRATLKLGAIVREEVMIGKTLEVGTRVWEIDEVGAENDMLDNGAITDEQLGI